MDEKNIKIAILAEEPLGWGSGKHIFPAILDGYTWKGEKINYTFHTEYIYDKDIIRGRLNFSNFDVLLVPGGGVGDGQSIVKGLTFLPRVRKWKKMIQIYVKSGGSYVGICGGAALCTKLKTKDTTLKPLEKLYDKSSIGISSVDSYYKDLALPLFSPIQTKNPEKIGATSYVFSFKPGTTKDGKHIFSGGASLDFVINKKDQIFKDYDKSSLKMRWWGGPGLILPKDSGRDINILARYPKKDTCLNGKNGIYAWKYVGGISGLFRGIIKSFIFIMQNELSLKHLFTYAFYFSGDWKKTNLKIDMDLSGRPCITSEVYPNENKGRIVLCTAHPEYHIWHGGYIDEADDSSYNCLAYGLHQWKDIQSFKEKELENLTNSWWLVRRLVAWAAKIPDYDLPPISEEENNQKVKNHLEKDVLWDGNIISQIKNI